MAPIQPRYLLISLTLAAHVLVFGLAWIQGVGIDFAGLARLYGLLVPVFAAGIAYTILRGMRPMRVVLECIGCGLILTVPVALSTYLAMRVNFPLADAALIRMDTALGFDWHGFIHFVDARPLLAESLAQAYQSFSFQLLGVPLLLVAFGKEARAYTMIIAYGVLCFVSSAISVFYPALGAYNVYGVAQEGLSHINAHFGFAFLQQFHAVRNDPDFIFSMTRMAGILTFPSVHVAVAVLCAWAMWDVRLLRYPFLILNGFMAVSAVTHGSHYLVDVIAGIGVAGFTISAVSALCRRHLSGAEDQRVPTAISAV